MSDEWKGYEPFGGIAKYWRQLVWGLIRTGWWFMVQTWYLFVLLILVLYVLQMLFGLLEMYERIGGYYGQSA